MYFNSDEAGLKLSSTQPRDWVGLALFVIVLIGGTTVAHRHFSLGRGDRRGALRLATVTLFAAMLTWLLTAQHEARPWEILWIVMEAIWALFAAATLWCLYMAIEPYARRHWPESLISWTRFQHGHLRNPLVASHVLAGVALAMCYWAGHLALRGATSINERQTGHWLLDSASSAMSLVVFHFSEALFRTMGILLLVVLARLLFRRVWIGDTAFVLLFSASRFLSYPELQQTILVNAWESLTVVASLRLFRRCGLLSLAAFYFVAPIVAFPAVDWSSWYAGRALLVQLIPVAIATWAVSVILQRRKVMY